MFSKHREILDRLATLERRLDGIDAALADLRHGDRLRAELERKNEQIEALSQQGLTVVELLDHARREIAALRHQS